MLAGRLTAERLLSIAFGRGPHGLRAARGKRAPHVQRLPRSFGGGCFTSRVSKSPLARLCLAGVPRAIFARHNPFQCSVRLTTERVGFPALIGVLIGDARRRRDGRRRASYAEL